jgi:hypothetical protein
VKDVIEPEDAAYGATDYVPDERLPLLASAWVAHGWDSPALLALASMRRPRPGRRRGG